MAPIRGLILAGGYSRRMGHDKASLTIDGLTLIERTARLLRAIGLPVIVSARSDQKWGGMDWIRVDDPSPSIGPAGGLLSAMTAHPDTAFLTLAVDLPRLRVATLKDLIDRRNPALDVTGYLNPGDGRLDPLCALYEPACAPWIRSAVDRGELSLRRILEKEARMNLVPLARPNDLIDLDTPESIPSLDPRPTTSPPCRP